MKYDNIIKRQTTIVVCSVIFMVIIIIGTSYSLFMQVNESTNVQVVESGNLTIAYQGGTAITTATEPQSDSDGLNTDGYNFTVTNNGTLPMNYNITIYNDPTTASLDGVTMIPHQYLKITIDGSDPVLLSEVTKTEATQSETNENNIKYTLKDNLTLDVGSSASHTIKIWIVEDAPTDIIDNTVSLEVDIYGEVPTE